VSKFLIKWQNEKIYSHKRICQRGGELMECKCCKHLSQLLTLMCLEYGDSFCMDCRVPDDHGCPGTEGTWGSYCANVARFNTWGLIVHLNPLITQCLPQYPFLFISQKPGANKSTPLSISQHAIALQLPSFFTSCEPSGIYLVHLATSEALVF